MLQHIRIFFALLVLLTGLVRAQEVNLDQLRTELDQVTQPFNRITKLQEIATAVGKTQPAEAILFLEEAIDLARREKFEAEVAKSYYQLAWMYLATGNERRAIKSFEAAVPPAQNTANTHILQKSYEMLENHYRQTNRNRKALEYNLLLTQLKGSLLQKETDEIRSDAQTQLSDWESKYATGQAHSQQVQAQMALEKDSIISALQLQEEIALRKEAEIARLTAESQLRAQEAELVESQLSEKVANQNLIIAISVLALLIMFALWQRYRIIQQREKVKAEKLRIKRLEQVDKLKDQFLANTSHELRTPLNGIIGIAESLYDEPEAYPVPALKENLSMVIASGKRLSNLVNDIMDFSKLQNADLGLEMKPIDLRSTVDIILKINKPMTRGKEVELINNIPTNLPAVEADENRIQQIFHNLVGNAVKFTPKGTVTLSARQTGDMIEIAVADTGIGIPDDKQKGIFTAFTQGDGSISRTYSGTGLGLSITQHLVGLHGGKIWVESELGKGSIFFITLKVTEAIAEEPQPDFALGRLQTIGESAAAGRTVDTRVLPVSANAHSLRILVVDDEPINQQVLRNHLSSENYILVSAMNGHEALEMIDSGEHFDLILLDIMMPRMSGYEVCQKIRTRYLPSELPIIMITAKNQVQDLVEGLAYGANDYLAKPFSKAEFLARIKTHINLFHINSAYGRFVPHEFLRNLGHESIIDVQLGDQVAKEVTVLFSDIRSYTTLAEMMTPSDNFRFLNSYLGRIGPIIKENRGFVNQYYGDGIMALFLEQSEDSLMASINMQKHITGYNAERVMTQRNPIKVGMGMHTGPLIMGILGDERRMEAGVVSDTVNMASRMEGLTKFYGASLIVSETSMQKLSNPEQYNYRFLGRVQVKGRKTPIGVYDFFDADQESVIAKKFEVKSLFEEGLAAYYDRKFPDAAKAFQAIINTFPEDIAAQHYLLRSTELAASGVPKNWTGVELMGTK